jgi:hypothetical protein
MRAAGSRTIAQGEATRVVWGIPGAISIGAVDDVVPIDEMAEHIHGMAEGMDFTKQAGNGQAPDRAMASRLCRRGGPTLPAFPRPAVSRFRPWQSQFWRRAAVMVSTAP